MKHLGSLIFAMGLLWAVCLAACSNNDSTQALGADLEVITFNSEDAENWKNVSEPGQFCFSIPESFQNTEVRGIDSKVLEFVGPVGQLGFDYGGYSRAATNPNVIINNLEAEITYEAIDGGAVYRLYFVTINKGPINLTSSLYLDSQDDKLAQNIFSTLKFGSDCP